MYKLTLYGYEGDRAIWETITLRGSTEVPFTKRFTRQVAIVVGDFDPNSCLVPTRWRVAYEWQAKQPEEVDLG